jgi:hypothetical protein
MGGVHVEAPDVAQDAAPVGFAGLQAEVAHHLRDRPGGLGRRTHRFVVEAEPPKTSGLIEAMGA